MSKVWIAAILMLLGSARASLAERTVVTVTGVEQVNSGVFDKGSLTVTINGISETVGYGQFSTNASLASGIAAKFSQNCNSTVLAHASGATITFITKDPAAAIGAVVATLSWDGQDFSAASFALNTPAPPLFTPGINCVPSTIVSGQSLTCDVILLAGASSPVTFSVGGSTWTSATPDPAGSAVANAPLSEASPGSYTIAYSYPGDANIPAASGTAQVNVTAPGATVPSGGPIYSFSIADQYGNSGYTPNSNIAAYTDSVNGTWNLGYDSLNRLTSSSQAAVNGVSRWGCWAYDSFGNMQTQAISTQAFSNPSSCQAQPGTSPLQSSLTYNTANQISSGTWLDASNNTHTGAPRYDAAGEMTSDLLNTYLYNAQGQVCAVQTGLTSFIGYLYDAEGHRVAKGTLQSLTCDSANLQITAAYFTGPDGETMTELDGNGSWVRTEVSGAGQHLATYTPTGLHLPVPDWLGTKRVTVNPNFTLNNGVEETCASFPFGDQQNCTTPIDAWPNHFTGKERDTESGLDYFGARYLSSSMGRWMSPDWSKYPDPIPYAYLENPQSLNLYTYVSNNPLKFSDPNGHHQECAPDTFDPKTNTVTAGACHEVADWWQFQGARRFLGRHKTAVKVTANVVIGVTAISGVFDAGASEAAIPGEIALEAALEGGAELAADILDNNVAGEIIGWGTSQSAEQVAVTEQLTASITESDVAGMEAKGLNRATVDKLIDVYEKAKASPATNTQAGPRLELMQRISQLMKK